MRSGNPQLIYYKWVHKTYLVDVQHFFQQNFTNHWRCRLFEQVQVSPCYSQCHFFKFWSHPIQVSTPLLRPAGVWGTKLSVDDHTATSSYSLIPSVPSATCATFFLYLPLPKGVWSKFHMVAIFPLLPLFLQRLKDWCISTKVHDSVTKNNKSSTQNSRKYYGQWQHQICWFYLVHRWVGEPP